MDAISTRWYSRHLEREVLVSRWGHFGEPLLLFPTCGGDAEEIERFHLIDAVRPWIDGGRVKVYSCDSVPGQTWLLGELSDAGASRVQNLFDRFVFEEVVPLIRHDCRSPDIEIVTAGASIGAFHALAALCRHPDVFKKAICLSGTFDIDRFVSAPVTLDLYYASPLHFLPNLGDGDGDGDALERLRSRFVQFAHGEGPFENPENSWSMAGVLGDKGVPNHVESWGTDWPHDWHTWRAMLPVYLERHLGHPVAS